MPLSTGACLRTLGVRRYTYHGTCTGSGVSCSASVLKEKLDEMLRHSLRSAPRRIAPHRAAPLRTEQAPVLVVYACSANARGGYIKLVLALLVQAPWIALFAYVCRNISFSL